MRAGASLQENASTRKRHVLYSVSYVKKKDLKPPAIAPRPSVGAMDQGRAWASGVRSTPQALGVLFSIIVTHVMYLHRVF